MIFFGKPVSTFPDHALACGRFLQPRQCFIDQPYDRILCGRPRRGFAGLDRLFVQPNAPLPGMGSALDDGVALAAIFHMNQREGTRIVLV
jgi:hypothetical protein